MNLRHLRVFVTVADLGSMTLAAKELFIAQPSVSQTIKELEEHYNIRLFERLARKLYLTEQGKEFLGYARHVVFLVNEMEHKMRRSVQSGIMRIGATITVGTCVLGDLYSAFLEHYPDVDIKSVVDNTRVIEDMVLKSELDFGLVEGPIHSEYILSQPFMDDELILVCGSLHPFRDKKVVSVEDLGQARLILREKGSGTRELFESTMTTKGLDMGDPWAYNSAKAIKNAVIANMGVTVISRMLVKDELDCGLLFHVKLDEIKFSRQFNIIYHRNKYISEPIKGFWDLCLAMNCA